MNDIKKLLQLIESSLQKTIIIKKRVTQNYLANKLGIDGAALSKIKNGKLIPNDENIKYLINLIENLWNK